MEKKSSSSSLGKAKPRGKHTVHQTLELIEKGMTVAEVAEEQEIQVSTVESHLAKLHEDGKLEDLSRWVRAEEIGRVEVAVQEIGGGELLRPIYEHLKEEVSFGKIRLGLAVLERRQTS